MSDNVFIPPAGRVASRRRGPFIPPTLILPFIVYNLIGFIFYGGQGAGWSSRLFDIPMVSGAAWSVTSADLILVLSLACLFVELVKSTRTGSASILEHMLSMAVFVLMLLEFILVGVAASSAFFLMTVMSLIDVVAGFTVSITGAGRDITME